MWKRVSSTLAIAVTVAIALPGAGAAGDEEQTSGAATEEVQGDLEPAAPDALPIIAPGADVRVASGLIDGPVRGRFLGTDGEMLHMLPDRGGPVSIPLASLTSLETSFASRRHTRRGLAIGVVAGLLIGAVSEVDEDRCDRGRQDEVIFCSRGEAIGSMIAGGGMLGAGIGALVQTTRWQPIAVERLRSGPLALRATPSGPSIALAFRW